ncbi:hypothetical protein [Rudanella lutea]|uniref:hypothetical protein n=1 Tax=Rudanella lutea TaxID=451374 RepID=UPI00037F02CD|nr:hypothetical protein [Rudanella lutea]
MKSFPSISELKESLTTQERWNLPTSKYFQTLEKAGVWIAILSAVLASIAHALADNSVPVPALLDWLCAIVGVAGTVVATLSKLTVDFEQVDWQKLHQQREIAHQRSLGYFK